MLCLGVSGISEGRSVSLSARPPGSAAAGPACRSLASFGTCPKAALAWHRRENLTRDGKSRRVCRVVWRKKPYVGVRFVEQSSEGADLEEFPRRKGNAAAKLSSPSRPPLASDGAIPSLLPQVRYADLGPGGNRSPMSPSFFALVFLLLLVVASAMFYVAGLELADETPWAVEVCDRARNFCEHPEWSAIPAVLMGVVFLAVKGMEL